VSSTGRTIAKNATVLMASQLVTWGLTLALTVVVPRYLGAENVGKLNFATSICAIVAVFVTFGMDTLLTKEVARLPESAPRLFANTVILRAGLQILGYLALALYLWLLRDRYPPQTVYVVCIVAITSLIWQFNSAGQAVLAGLERMEFNSIANVAGKAANTVVCLAALLAGASVYLVAAIAAASSLVTLGVELAALKRLTGSLRLRLERSEAVRMLRASFPYFMSGVFLVIYMQVDIVIISLLVNERTVGWYGTADQLFGTFLFIPTVFISAVFPALSRMYATAVHSLSKLMSKSWDLLMLLAIPIGLGLVVVANPLVVLLFGPDFAGSGPILALMGIVLILTYQNILLGQFLVATDRQNPWTVVMAVTTLITVPLDFLFVPWCQRQFGNGGLGGGLSFIVTELAMNVAGVWLLPRGSLGRSNIRTAALGLAAGLVMVAAAWPLRNYFLGLPIIAGAAVYIGLIILLRVVPAEDWQLVGSLARGAVQRVRTRRAAA
jgi:O-antigen/teichoic acid export membrane protein